MLIERGAERVVSFDISPAPKDALDDPRVEYVQGDLTSAADVDSVHEGMDCSFHIGALVGPYHAESSFEGVNYGGSINVLEACKKHGVRKLVMSSSPSTRFPYPDPNVRNLTEDDLFKINGGEYATNFYAPYARTKAMGERAVLAACSDELMTIAVAPHQVYGPRDPLFLPKILEAAFEGKLRIFGKGDNMISFTHVDNYCHGLILGAEALSPESPALGRFFIVTDGGGHKLWEALDQAVVGMGLPSLKSKRALPAPLMLLAGRLSLMLGKLISTFSGTPFHDVMKKLKITPFTVKMLLIDRQFNIQRARQELNYEPVIPFEQGWADTIAWFAERHQRTS